MKKTMLIAFALAAFAGLLVHAVFAADCAVTYDGFGKAFMDKYCTACHSSAKSGFARMGAPAAWDVDTLDGIKKGPAKILDEVEKGKMPPMPPKPTDEEKAQLKTFLDCLK